MGKKKRKKRLPHNFYFFYYDLVFIRIVPKVNKILHVFHHYTCREYCGAVVGYLGDRQLEFWVILKLHSSKAIKCPSPYNSLVWVITPLQWFVLNIHHCYYEEMFGKYVEMC